MRSKLADKTDLDLEVLVELLPYLGLRDCDQLTDIFRGCFAEIYHDVGMDVRDLRIAVTKTLQSNLVDQAAGSNSFNFLED